MNFNKKVFLVTGGSSGIGKAVAHDLVQEGAIVYITGRNETKLKQVAEEIGAKAIHADVSNDSDIEKTFDVILSENQQLDGLINNAGIAGSDWPEVDKLKRSLFEEVYQINVFGAAVMGAKAAEIFKKQQSGNIVNIASTAGLKGFARGSVYASSKFALRGITQCWQAELRPYNVRVMLVNPSEVPTAFNQESREERPDEAKKLTSEEISHAILSALKMDDRGFIPELTVWATNPFYKLRKCWIFSQT